MWAFFDFGLLMPALVPAKHANDAAVLAWTNNGEYELQVRGRLKEHLEYFMQVYMEPGTFNPVIQATPDKDYNYRFYTTREAYAEGIKQAALAMDYEKFKVTSDRFSWNKKYHTILTSIWSRVCDLNQPGGIWGPRSSYNPDGYTSASRYRGWDSYDYEQAHNEMEGIGSSFGQREDWPNELDPELWDQDWQNVNLGDDPRYDWTMNADGEWERGEQLQSSDMDYTPLRVQRIEALLQEMADAGLEPELWEESLLEHEWDLVKDIAEAMIEKNKQQLRKQRRKDRRRTRRANRQQHQYRNTTQR